VPVEGRRGAGGSGGALLGSFGGPLPHALKPKLGGGYTTAAALRGTARADEELRAQRLAAARAAAADVVARADTEGGAGGGAPRGRGRRLRVGAASAGVRRQTGAAARAGAVDDAGANGGASAAPRRDDAADASGTGAGRRSGRAGGSYSARVRRDRVSHAPHAPGDSSASVASSSSSVVAASGTAAARPGLHVQGERPARQQERSVDPRRARSLQIAQARREAAAARRAELRLDQLHMQHMRALHAEHERAAIVHERRVTSLLHRAVAAGIIDDADEDPEMALALALSSEARFGNDGGGGDGLDAGVSDLRRLEEMLGIARAEPAAPASGEGGGPLGGLEIGVVQLLGSSFGAAGRRRSRPPELARDRLYTPEHVDLSYEALCELEDVVVPTPADVLARMPTTAVDVDGGGECNVCLLAYEAGDRVRTLPCDHRFHVDCVDQWLGRSKACPVCKHDVVDGRGATEPTAAELVAAE